MLYLIGLGLEKDDISVKALSLIKKCKEIYLEYYTSDIPYSVKDLEKVLGKKIITVDRDFVEEAEILLKRAKSKNVALLVYGDPLIATTHTALLQEAKKMKVKVLVLHNISVFNAITDTGLEAYKFGKITSIPKYSKSFKPTSFIHVFKENQKINAHTLFLVDIGLELQEAISYLSSCIDKKTKCIVCSCLGTKNQKIIYAYVEKLPKKVPKPFCIIVPAKLHFAESDFLKRYK